MDLVRRYLTLLMNILSFSLDKSSIVEAERSFQEMAKKISVLLTVRITIPVELKGLTPVLMQ